MIICSCPRIVAKNWWTLFLRLGYDVHLASKAYYVSLLGSRLKADKIDALWNESCYGLVIEAAGSEISCIAERTGLIAPSDNLFDDEQLATRSGRGVAYLSGYFDPGAYLSDLSNFSVSIRGDIRVLRVALRQLLAAGCFHCSRFVGLTRFYSFNTPQFPDRWRRFLQEHASSVCEMVPEPGDAIRAIVSKGRSSVVMDFGQGFDLGEEEPTFYGALDYRLPLLARKSTINLVNDLERNFIVAGAARRF